MKMLLPMVRRVVVGAVVVVLAACSGSPPSDPPDGHGRFDHGGTVSVDDLEDHLRELPAVVDVVVERVEADSGYWVVDADVLVQDDIGRADLSEVVRVLGEAAPRINGSDFAGSVRLARDAPRDETDLAGSVLHVRDEPRQPGRQAAAFLTAIDSYPEAVVKVDGGLLSITGTDPRGKRVSDVLASIAADPDLGRFPSTVVGVQDAVEGLPTTQVWVDEPLSETAIAHWQAVVDVVGSTPRQAAPTYAYVLVRDGAIDVAEVVLDGDLPDDVPPDFATWNPVLAPMIEQLLVLGATNAHPEGTGIDVGSPAGDFAVVFITETAVPSDYGDPAWCQWAADVANAVR